LASRYVCLRHVESYMKLVCEDEAKWIAVDAPFVACDRYHDELDGVTQPGLQPIHWEQPCYAITSIGPRPWSWLRGHWPTRVPALGRWGSRGSSAFEALEQ
jgi:hypothetical protein